MGMIKLPKKSIDFFNDNYPNIFESGNLAEGEWGNRVAEWSCVYTSSKHAVAVNSNGAGLFALLRILKQYRQKKKVFLQSNTMYGVKTIAISSGLNLCGYVNCSFESLMPKYEQVKQFINLLEKPDECVFLLTHIGGWVNSDIIKIAALCKAKGIVLIEDCAHTFGSTLEGNHTGTFGDAGVYSFYATKAIPVGEGGIVVTKDKELYEMMEKFIMYDRFDQKLDIGVNLRMSEINALMTYSVIQETEAIIQNKYKIAKKYIDACKKYNWNYIDPRLNRQRSNLYKFILLSSSENPKEEFSQITSRTSPVYDYVLGSDVNQVTKRHICLPIWYGLENKKVNKVISELER